VLLAIETSSRAGSVALLHNDGSVKSFVSLETPRDHAQRLAPTVQALLPDGFEDIEAYAVSIGPGSFTGLRIGVAFLKGLAMVYSRPTYSVSSLEVMAATAVQAAEGKTSCMAVIDARRGNVFTGLFDADLNPDPTFPEGMYPVALIRERFGAREDLMWTGEGAALVEPVGPVAAEGLWTPRADVLGARALVAQSLRPGADPLDISPTYHQLSAAEEAIGIQAV
jgi:tRNA threonylcarbamoyl adenosine modification protein YeaZ